MITDEWAKSSKSGPNCDNCVECRRTADGNVELRDTKDRSKPAMVFTQGEWNAFIAGAKADEFDLPA